ncbi:hypothetical protein PPYR_05482 [Photinus pyralis]|uniref:Uncharacterized protein n=3 Tax=Photinus pyralis TaxID=7054 RepID=A0A5N4AV65_PHOPY|nr:hypothetical protein PPYR_05482 [Photinus pyralis]
MGKTANLRRKKRNAKKRGQRATKTLHKHNVPAGRKILQDSSLQQKGLGDIAMASTSRVEGMEVSDDKDFAEVEMSSQCATTSSSGDENDVSKERVLKPLLGLQQDVMLDNIPPATSLGKIGHYGICLGDRELRVTLTRVTESKMDICQVSSSMGVDENTIPDKQIIKSGQEVMVGEEPRLTRRQKIISDLARKQVVDSVTSGQTAAITAEDEHSPLLKKKKVVKRRNQAALISSTCKETPKTAKKRRTKTQGDHAVPSTSKQISESETDTSTAESREDFKRYGMHVPTFQEMMAYRKEYEKMEKEVEFIDAAIAEPIIKVPEEPQKEPVPILDCKHLTEDQLQILLEQNYLFAHNIFHGITKNARHDRFKATKYHRITFSKSNLIYNTSMIVFSYEQKRFMLKYLYSKFDNEGEFHTQTDYFFKVLLPELCTKIFMDTYQMTKEEAESYLAVRPAGK